MIRMKREEMKMPVEIPSAIKLEDAFFCLGCETVTNCSDVCPGCGYEQLWPLENWLGRVNGHENSGDKESTVPEVQPERTADLSKISSRKNCWQRAWNYSWKSLVVGLYKF
jgi:hypothetical protein